MTDAFVVREPKQGRIVPHFPVVAGLFVRQIAHLADSRGHLVDPPFSGML
jgi:hypothetical protein